jgi:cell division cycle 20-like protein 1 (cofactor of APC complex)
MLSAILSSQVFPDASPRRVLEYTKSPEKTGAASLSPLASLFQNPADLQTRCQRKIPNNPYKVLDAPGLSDNFYYNVLDWSSSDILAVGLGTSVYLWHGEN